MILIALGLLIGIVYFTTATWPLYIDLVVFGLCVLLSVPGLAFWKKNMSLGLAMGYKAAAGAMAGIVLFICLFFWGGLPIYSFWTLVLWYLLSAVMGAVGAFIPGGITLAVYLFKNMEAIYALPNWILAAAILMDVIGVILYVISFCIKERKKLTRAQNAMLTSLSNQAAACLKLGDNQKALELCEKIYALSCKFLGEAHPDTQAALRILNEVREIAKTNG